MTTNTTQHITLRTTNTTKNHQDKRVSLLSSSSSGIDKGDDASSVDTSSNFDPNGDVELSQIWIEGDDDIGKGTFELKPLLVKPETNLKYETSTTENGGKSPSTEENYKSEIPDGGWGWIVVLSSFIISVIADGTSFSFGLLYIEFLEEFKASKSVTAWIGSLFIAVPLLSGPVMSALVDRYGCRSMTIIGGLISATGFVLASISTSLESMLITFGVISGMGLGLVYVTAVVSIAYWFEKKRNLAVGLGACGTGVGTFIYAPLTQYLIKQYGWRGAVLLLSGTLLNLCVCGCVMRDPEWWILEQKRQNSKDIDKSKLRKSPSLNFPEIFHRIANMKKLIERGSSPTRVINQEYRYLKKQEIVKLDVISKNKSKSLIDLTSVADEVQRSTNKMTNESHNKISLDETKTNTTNEYNDNIKRTNSEILIHKANEEIQHDEAQPPGSRRVFKKSNSESKSDVNNVPSEEKRDWLKKQLSIDHSYLRNLKIPINSISHRNAILNIKKYKLKVSSCPNIFKNSMITLNEEEEKWYEPYVICCCDMFNVNLFKEPSFNLLCLSAIILFIWFIVPYFYLAEHMNHNGYTEDDAALVLSLIGITNGVGMVGLGWIGDFPKVSIGYLYGFCLIICGITVFVMPLVVSHYWLLSSISSAFGFFFASSFSLTPSLLVKLVSLDDFTTAYGLVLLAEGIGHLIGPPLSGLIYDLTLSWELSFYLAGGWIVVAGILVSFIQPVRAYQEYRRRKNGKYHCNTP